jgi:ribosomal protein L37AE/L43A
MGKQQHDVECEVCGYLMDISTSRYTRIGWVCERCFPTYSIISDKERNALQVTLQRRIESTIVAVFK